MNLLYLCALDAEHPERVREYLVQADVQVDDLIKMHGLDRTKVKE